MYWALLKICAIGSATAKALHDKGLLADIIPSDYKGESVVKALAPILEKGDKALLIQPKVARKVIPEALKRPRRRNRSAFYTKPCWTTRRPMLCVKP